MDNNVICVNNNFCGFLNVVSERLNHLVKQKPITDYYNVEQRPFARGKFATVRRCCHKETNIDYAAKFIRKRRRAMDVRHEIIHEIAVLEMCGACDYIVKLHEVYETSTEMVLVLELASGGEVQRLIDEDEVLEEKDVVRLMRQILEGLSFLHDRNIAHLDIKPQNLLLTSTYPKCDVKLCDFGISRVIKKGIEIREIMGTPDYVAPEVLNYEPISLPTDMWSVGVLTYVLLTGHSPFGGDTKQETFCNISHVNLEFPDDLFHSISPQAKDFIRKLLVKDASARLTARDCFNHPWLRPEPNTTTTTNNNESNPLMKSPRTHFRFPQQSRDNCDKENINVDQLEFNSHCKYICDEGVVCCNG
ncbi:hypothetical protein CHUAL_013860 [Chamberlinius hualienensis]